MTSIFLGRISIFSKIILMNLDEDNISILADSQTLVSLLVIKRGIVINLNEAK